MWQEAEDWKDGTKECAYVTFLSMSATQILLSRRAAGELIFTMPKRSCSGRAQSSILSVTNTSVSRVIIRGQVLPQSLNMNTTGARWQYL